jgi:phage terminase large subunit GpA-like protein
VVGGDLDVQGRDLSFPAARSAGSQPGGWGEFPSRLSPPAGLGRHRVAQAWQKLRERNEALDCRVYARAAAWILGADRWTEARWVDLEAQLGQSATDRPVAAISAATRTRSVSVNAQRRMVRSSYMG